MKPGEEGAFQDREGEEERRRSDWNYRAIQLGRGEGDGNIGKEHTVATGGKTCRLSILDLHNSRDARSGFPVLVLMQWKERWWGKMACGRLHFFALPFLRVAADV